MGSHADAFTVGAFADILFVLGQTVTHTTEAGESTSIQAVFEEIGGGREQEDDGLYFKRRGELLMSTGAANGITSPDKDDHFTINGELWAIEDSSDRDDEIETITFQLVRDERDEASGRWRS